MFFRDHGVVYQVEKIYLCHVKLRKECNLLEMSVG